MAETNSLEFRINLTTPVRFVQEVWSETKALTAASWTAGMDFAHNYPTISGLCVAGVFGLGLLWLLNKRQRKLNTKLPGKVRDAENKLAIGHDLMKSVTRRYKRGMMTKDQVVDWNNQVANFFEVTNVADLVSPKAKERAGKLKAAKARLQAKLGQVGEGVAAAKKAAVQVGKKIAPVVKKPFGKGITEPKGETKAAGKAA